MEKNAKIYVAGHRGLVGSAIWKNLLARGYTNLIGKSSQELDLRDKVQVQRFFESERPEYVFLAAAKVGGIVANNTYRADFIYENLMIQNNVIHSAWQYEVKKLLFLGSTCIYPRDAPQPMPENCLLTNVLEYTNEPYAIAKIAGLKMCESYNLQYGTDFIAVMPTNLYGPNDNFDLERSHVLPALVRKLYLGSRLEREDWDAVRADLNLNPVAGVDGKASQEAIAAILARFGVNVTSETPDPSVSKAVAVEIWGTGAPLREFLWSEEMADACVHIMEKVTFKELATLSGEKEVRNCHLNIGTGKELSIRELAELIQRKTDFRGAIRFDASKPDGTMRKLTDPSKLHTLGWHHQIDIEEGIDRMLAWYLAGRR